jgi:hypothetical protein
VATGEVDAAITNRFYGLTHAKTFDLEDTAVIFHPSNLFFAGPAHASQPLLDAIDNNLLKLKSDPQSVYYRSLKRWVSEEVLFKLPTWIQGLGLTAGVVLLTSLVGSVVLKRQVNRRTRELHNINRVLRTFSECNQALVHSADETGLIETVCRILLDIGGYRLAWIGLTDGEPTQEIRIVSHAGIGERILSPADLDKRLAEPIGRLTQKAFETGKPCSAHHRFADPDLAPPQAQAFKRKEASVLVLPLLADGERLGVLCIYTAEPDAFNTKAVAQLTELASDLSFGIANRSGSMRKPYARAN